MSYLQSFVCYSTMNWWRWWWWWWQTDVREDGGMKLGSVVVPSFVARCRLITDCQVHIAFALWITPFVVLQLQRYRLIQCLPTRDHTMMWRLAAWKQNKKVSYRRERAPCELFWFWCGQRARQCVRISRKSDSWKWVKRRISLVTKSLELRFSPPFCARLLEGAKSLQGSVPHEPTSPCKISSQSVSVCRNYFRKVISYERNAFEM